MISTVIPFLISGQSEVLGIQIHTNKMISIIGYLLLGLIYSVFLTIALNEMMRGVH
jgi:hypothetical protein